MKNGKRPIANPFVMLREEFDDWAVLFDPDSAHGFGLNPAGVCLWKLLDGEHTLDDLLEEIRRYTERVPEEARDHVVAFVDELVAEGLAGFDIGGFGLPYTKDRQKRRCSPPHERLSEEKQFRYEPPQLVDFLANRRAAGSCQYGSGDSGSCLSGTSAGSR